VIVPEVPEYVDAVPELVSVRVQSFCEALQLTEVIEICAVELLIPNVPENSTSPPFASDTVPTNCWPACGEPLNEQIILVLPPAGIRTAVEPAEEVPHVIIYVWPAKVIVPDVPDCVEAVPEFVRTRIQRLFWALQLTEVIEICAVEVKAPKRPKMPAIATATIKVIAISITVASTGGTARFKLLRRCDRMRLVAIF
jgi:hypothetical protein